MRLAKFSNPTPSATPSDSNASPKKEEASKPASVSRPTEPTTPPRPTTPKVATTDIRPSTPPKTPESKEQKIHRLLTQIFKVSLNIRVKPILPLN